MGGSIKRTTVLFSVIALLGAADVASAQFIGTASMKATRVIDGNKETISCTGGLNLLE
jgi:hypothetical protein